MRRWVVLSVACAAVIVSGVAVTLHLLSTSAIDDATYLRNALAQQREGQPFELTIATRFRWDTLEVFGLGLTPLTGGASAQADSVPMAIKDQLRYESEDFVLAFVRAGHLVRAIPVNAQEPIPALTRARASGFSSSTGWVKVKCRGWWTGQPYALLTFRGSDGPPSTCP